MNRRALLALAALALAACARPSGTAPNNEHWLVTWYAPPQLTEQRNMPPAPGIANSTLRQVVHLTLGGPRIRVKLSNTFGDGPIVVTAAHIARSTGIGTSGIDVATDRKLTFHGADTVTLAAGTIVTADPIDYPVDTFADLAITLQLGAVPAALTGHPGSRTTSYFKPGQWVSAPELGDVPNAERWYVIMGIDVVRQGAAIVALGNSITDGNGSTTNHNDRWPDNLARRLQADPRTRDVSVANSALGGNRVLTGGLGPYLLSRLDRDVLDIPGARWVILLEGVNDLGSARDSVAVAEIARQLIVAYRQIVERCHARGLKVYGATILPYGGSQYGQAPGQEAARRTVNEFIRTSGLFDAVIDLDAATRDPAHPDRMLPNVDKGDHLHPGAEGHRVIADAIDLGLFVP